MSSFYCLFLLSSFRTKQLYSLCLNLATIQPQGQTASRWPLSCIQTQDLFSPPLCLALSPSASLSLPSVSVHVSMYA